MHNIINVADMETGLQHLIARGPSILYANYGVTRSDLKISVWTSLAKTMFLWVPQRPQSPECYYYYRPHNLPLSSSNIKSLWLLLNMINY